MKLKFILVISIPLSTITAQDSLLLINKQIEIVSVLTIEDTVITYKQNAKPDGPTYTKNKSEIDRIIFSNGAIAFFNYQSDVTQLPIKGSNILIEADDSKIRNLNKTANQLFRSWGYWNIVSNPGEANYILEIEVLYNGFSLISWGKVKISGIIKSIAGNPLWVFEGFSGESNGFNGFNPTAAAINNLIKKGIEPNIHY